jgi:hypothetical protein
MDQRERMFPFSNSRLEGMNQCPVWGTISAQKRYEYTSRSMALEAGETMHQVYAAVRIWQLEHVQGLPHHARAVANRIFGKDRWKHCIKSLKSEDDRENLLQLCFEILHSSEWFDDPGDEIRTMSNMELSAIKYVDERLPYMENWPIYVEDEKTPNCRVGIEQVFDVVLYYNDGKEIRYIGTIDGLVKKTGKTWCLDENKTASRLDQGWRAKWDIYHQITGYCACSTSVFGFPVWHSRITGAKIKPTGKGEDIIAVEPLPRTAEHIYRWAAWLRSTAETYERYKDNWEYAPRYTHSCNRYFRPCALIPFCNDTAEGRRIAFETQMVAADPSPSERAVMEI